MRYWNKSKNTREKHWHNVKEPSAVHSTIQGMYAPYVPSIFLTDRKRWCQQQPSKGKFYYTPYTGWWFELESDASWFIMTWYR